jgi:hypothetical protein
MKWTSRAGLQARLFGEGSRCGMTTNAMPESGGRLAKKLRTASNPAVLAPIGNYGEVGAVDVRAGRVPDGLWDLARSRSGFSLHEHKLPPLSNERSDGRPAVCRQRLRNSPVSRSQSHWGRKHGYYRMRETVPLRKLIRRLDRGVVNRLHVKFCRRAVLECHNPNVVGVRFREQPA